MKKLYVYLLGLVSMILAQSCYDDKGNYDYHAVNDLKIEIPEAKVRMPKQDSVIATLKPELTQTLAESESNLTFEWKKLKEGAKIGSDRLADYEDYSTGKDCDVVVRANNPESIGMMLVVSDNATGQKWYQLGKVAVVKPLNPAWFVLQENENHASTVGAVEGDATGFFAYSDVFKSETGNSFSLEGKPLAIAAKGQYGSSYNSMFTRVFSNLTIATDKNVAIFDPSTLTMKYGTNKIMFENAMNNAPVNLSYYKMDKYGEMYVTDKKAYFSYEDGWTVPYSVLDTDVDGETQTTPLPKCFATFGQYYPSSVLVYDETNHRFRIGTTLSSMEYITVSFQGSSYTRNYGSTWRDRRPLRLRDLNEDEEGTYAFDPNKVDASLKVLDILRGGDGGNYAYAMMAVPGSSELTIYRFSNGDDPLCAGKYTIPVDPSIDLSSAKFAASQAYSAHFVFMAAGNSVYRIDMERQKIEQIYTYEEDSNAKIACLKFRDPLSTDEGLGMVLGFGINTSDGKGLLGELQLTVAGDVDRSDNAAYVFVDAANPFGKIVDISYNYE